MWPVASMEWNGTPIDTDTLERLRLHWDEVLDNLIIDVDKQYHIYDGHTFKMERFEHLLIRRDIPWPRTEKGRLVLEDKVFKAMKVAYPFLADLYELRVTMGSMRLNSFRVGRDGRNRAPLFPFGSRSGRNQPSNTEFIFGPSTWFRSLIKPTPGCGVAYIDYCREEFGIAAALSGDTAMQAAYMSGDPYMAFAKQAGAVPQDATKASHGAVRELFKTCVLGVQYGMGRNTLAARIDQPTIVASDLLQAHRDTYRTFWRWSGLHARGPLRLVFRG